VAFIEGATESIFDHNCPKTQIHSVKYGGQHAHVGLGAGDNEAVDAFIAEKRRKTGFRKRRISGLIDDCCRRYQAG
jgi:hypothetical protein